MTLIYLSIYLSSCADNQELPDSLSCNLSLSSIYPGKPSWLHPVRADECKSLLNSQHRCIYLNVGVDLHLRNFSFDSVADFWNTGVRASTSAEHAPCLQVCKTKWFARMVWNWLMEIFWWLFFSFIKWRHSSRWVATVSWLNYLICELPSPRIRLNILLTCFWIPIHHTASHGSKRYMFVWLVSYSILSED